MPASGGAGRQPRLIQHRVYPDRETGNVLLDRQIKALARDLSERGDPEYHARDLVDRMALALQSSLLIRHAPSFVADAFCASRLAPAVAHNYGALPKGADVAAIMARAAAHDDTSAARA